MEQRPQATEDHHHDLTAITSLSPVSTAGGHEHGTPEPASSQPAAGIKRRLQLSSNRLLSLDLLRGLAILLMITCNAQVGDNVFPILSHPEWIGFTIADTIFPSFLFITGCTVPLSIRADPNPKPGSHYYRNQALRVFKRSVIIWFLGVVLNLYGLVQLHVGGDQFRWPNVLNRIGFCYLVVGWMHLLVLWRGRQPEKPLSTSYLFSADARQPRSQPTEFAADSKILLEDDQHQQAPREQDDSGSWPWFFRVTLPYYLPAACLIIWLICTYTVQVEGCPERAMIYNSACSPQAYFDLKIFGTNHTYRHLNFDPEGSLSTLTSILNVWFGWFIGCTVRSLNAQVKQVSNDFKAQRENRGSQESLVETVLEQEMVLRLYSERLGQWFWWGILWMFTGWIFSFGLPLSKPSWTATFAVLTAGVSQTMLSILFYKFDVQPKVKQLKQLHLDHQGFRSNNQLDRHYRHRDGDLERSGAATRTNYSSLLHVYFQVDHFLRHWFRKGIIVVLGSMGRNAILMYMCSELVQGTCWLVPGGPPGPDGKALDLFTTVYNHTWGALDIGGWGSLFYGMGFAALHVLLAIFLDHKKWYFKV